MSSLELEAASSGALALFHAVGVTPEAATREEAFQDGDPLELLRPSLDEMQGARDELSTAPDVRC